MTTEIDGALRLVTATVAGAVLGLPASLRGRRGGLRTHGLVSMGAALFCLIVRVHSPDELGRIVAGVATGIGFVGGASVLKSRQRLTGVANAASIWIAAGIGCTAGLGEVRRSLILSLVTVLLSTALLHTRRTISPRTNGT